MYDDSLTYNNHELTLIDVNTDNDENDDNDGGYVLIRFQHIKFVQISSKYSVVVIHRQSQISCLNKRIEYYYSS